jgi:hypothetical protein
MEKRLVLNSWKEIADYMGRGVRTIQRYERDLGLPVHRPAGKSRSAVIAFADEIDQWMRKGPLGALRNGDAARHETHQAEWQRLMDNSELLLKRANVLKAQMRELSRLIEETEKRRKLMMNRRSLAASTQALRSKMTQLAELMMGARGGDYAMIQSSRVPTKPQLDKKDLFGKD